MCRCCKGVFNIHERIANHNFMEQIYDFQGITPKYIKNRHKSKNTKKSVLNRIEYQLQQVQYLAIEQKEYVEFKNQLENLLSNPFNYEFTLQRFEEIMNQIYMLKRKEILEYYRSIAHG